MISSDKAGVQFPDSEFFLRLYESVAIMLSTIEIEMVMVTDTITGK
jgi:hypothetical protein